jgi:hypothetical protein
MILRLDVDTRRPLRQAELVDRLRRACRRLVWLSYRRSPSGRGWHLEAAVSPAPRTAVELVALQLLCGSDPHREAYNVNRARAVDSGAVSRYWSKPSRWNVFYSQPEEML